MWVWSTCPWWNREVQITEFVKQWIPAQFHCEADASKDGQIRPQIRPHIRQLYPAGAGYENLAGFRPGPDMISGATLVLFNTLTVATFFSTPGSYSHTWHNASCVKEYYVFVVYLLDGNTLPRIAAAQFNITLVTRLLSVLVILYLANSSKTWVIVYLTINVLKT